ncbi:MAG TPA: MFS transporter [Caulifigura sp.]|nr:MFS transporter [Caulifigura sp.]
MGEARRPGGSTAEAPPDVVHPRPGENLVIWTLWLTYGSFYFCRQNLSTVVLAIEQPVDKGGLGLTGEQMGWILASLKIAYGLGQLLNGQLSERVSPRVMLAMGMFGSAALNVLFGLSEGFFFLLFVWAANGFCQSLGWSPCVRVAANWVPVSRRGQAIGIIGTGYQVTQGLTYIVAGQAAAHLGWRGALYVPAAILSAAGLFMLVFLRDAPGDGPGNDADPAAAGVKRAASLPLKESLYWTLFNPALWLLGLALGLLNACRYGFLDWGVKHLMSTRNLKVDKATLQFFVIAIGATAGSYLAGWATDRYFGSRRAPVVCFLMALLGGLALLYDSPVTATPAGLMCLLVVIGFCIFGPQVLLVGTAPADLAHRGTSAAAAGFVNFMGYMGAATGDVVTGHFSSSGSGGWQRAILMWALWAFAGSAVTAVLWNTTSHRLKIIPGWVPRLGGIGTLTAAGVALSYGQQPMILAILTIAAWVCLFGTFARRWLACPALATAVVGVVTIFLGMVQKQTGATWPDGLGLLSFGLTVILTLMILVEPDEKPAAV